MSIYSSGKFIYRIVKKDNDKYLVQFSANVKRLGKIIWTNDVFAVTDLDRAIKRLVYLLEKDNQVTPEPEEIDFIYPGILKKPV